MTDPPYPELVSGSSFHYGFRNPPQIGVIMLAVISPAKKLNYDQASVNLPTTNLPTTEIAFADEAWELVQVARTLSPKDLSALMHISDDLAQLNFERFRDYKAEGSNQRLPAIQAFKGDVYVGFDVDTLAATDLSYAQDHLRILSGLYGLLRPLDMVQAYRLEMGSKLKTPHGANLYQFWGTKIAEALNDAMAQTDAAALVNLASNEYFKSVKVKALNKPVLNVNFMEYKDGVAKVISFNAKKARGMMARFMAEQKVDKPEGLKDFQIDRYSFDNSLSADGKWVFSRDFIPVAQQNLKKAA
ncbi:MAG: peroxide stress protein YaaA [Alphaproteobacteria bacterium]